MPRCPICQVPLIDERLVMCPHHVNANSDDWARSNRVFCNWIHRGIILPEPREDRSWRVVT